MLSEDWFDDFAFNIFERFKDFGELIVNVLSDSVEFFVSVEDESGCSDVGSEDLQWLLPV